MRIQEYKEFSVNLDFDDEDFNRFKSANGAPDYQDATKAIWYFKTANEVKKAWEKANMMKSKKECRILEDVKIPGSNIILERGDRIYYTEEIDDDDAEFIKDQIGASGLACVKKLDAAGFTEDPEGAKEGFFAKNIQGFSYHVGKDGFTITKDRKQVFKGKHSDVSKGLAAMKKYKD